MDRETRGRRIEQRNVCAYMEKEKHEMDRERNRNEERRVGVMRVKKDVKRGNKKGRGGGGRKVSWQNEIFGLRVAVAARGKIRYTRNKKTDKNKSQGEI